MAGKIRPVCTRHCHPARSAGKQAKWRDLACLSRPAPDKLFSPPRSALCPDLIRNTTRTPSLHRHRSPQPPTQSPAKRNDHPTRTMRDSRHRLSRGDSSAIPYSANSAELRSTGQPDGRPHKLPWNSCKPSPLWDNGLSGVFPRPRTSNYRGQESVLLSSTTASPSTTSNATWQQPSQPAESTLTFISNTFRRRRSWWTSPW